MKTLLHITFAKLRKSPGKSLLQAFAALVSFFILSFLLCFVISLEEFKLSNPTLGLEATSAESALTVEAIKEFFAEIISGISFIAIALIILTFSSLFIFSRLQAEENRRFLATLASIGATGSQRAIISASDALILYGIPIISGSLLGMLPSQLFVGAVAKIFATEHSPSPLSALPSVLLSALGILLVLLANRAPRGNGGVSLMENVKAHNKGEAESRHNYRKSYTFRHMPIEKRLAKKSVAYHSSTYNRITFMFIASVLYPFLAILFFALVSDTRVIDHTPGYGIDVAELVEVFAGNIALFGILSLLALTLFGVLQAVYIIKAHSIARAKALTAYKSIGMTDPSIKRMLRYEYGSALSRAVIYLIFIILLSIIGINSL